MDEEYWYAPGDLGLVVSVRVRPDGKARLMLGQVKRSGSNAWRDDAPLTYKDFDAAAFKEVELTEGILSDLGLIVIANLAARLDGVKG